MLSSPLEQCHLFKPPAPTPAARVVGVSLPQPATLHPLLQGLCEWGASNTSVFSGGWDSGFPGNGVLSSFLYKLFFSFQYILVTLGHQLTTGV